MAQAKRSIVVLRIATCLTIVLGMMAVTGGLISNQMLNAFGTPFPAWIVGAVVAYTGIRYWLRLATLERRLAGSEI